MTRTVNVYLKMGPIRDLLDLCESFSELTRGAGIDVSPFEDESVKILDQISPPRIQEIFTQFETIYQLFQKAKAKNQNLRDTRQLTWWAVKELGMRPPSDFFDKILETDIVECYNSSQVQIFRSLSFFDFCSYDVLSILIRPWHELYGRDLHFHDKAFAEMIEVLSKGDSTLLFTLPEHRLWEVSSKEKREFTMLHKYRGPLFLAGSHQPDGIIMTSHVERLHP